MVSLRISVPLTALALCCSICIHAQEADTAIVAPSDTLSDAVASKFISYPSYKTPAEANGKKSGKKKLEPLDRITLTGVELGDTVTVLTFEYTCLSSPKDKQGRACSIDNDSFLVTTKDDTCMYYDFLGAEGIAIAPGKTKVTRGETVSFKLIFEPLPEGTERFNMCEPPWGWNFADIELSSSSTPDKQQVGTFDLEQYTVRPTFLGGGVNELSSWVDKRLVYPPVCKRAKLEGNVLLKLTVGKDGAVSASALKGTNQSFIDEALRVAGMLPPMTSGSMYGRKCIVTYHFPVMFRLQNNNYPIH